MFVSLRVCCRGGGGGGGGGGGAQINSQTNNNDNDHQKEPMSKDVAEGDAFHFNDRFSSKLFKVKIGTVSASKEGEAEKQETRHKVRGTGVSFDCVWCFCVCCVLRGGAAQGDCE